MVRQSNFAFGIYPNDVIPMKIIYTHIILSLLEANVRLLFTPPKYMMIIAQIWRWYSRSGGFKNMKRLKSSSEKNRIQKESMRTNN